MMNVLMVRRYDACRVILLEITIQKNDIVLYCLKDILCFSY